MRDNLPEGIIVDAMRNARHHFVIPSVEKYFGGIQYDFVMIHNGSNGLLLPFPSSPEVLQQYNDAIFFGNHVVEGSGCRPLAHAHYQSN